MNLKFSGAGLAFLAHFKAENDIRYYLDGVYLAPMPAEAGGGVLGAATNGHVLGMWHDKDGRIDRPVIARITKPLVAACKKPDVYLTELDGRLAAVKYEAITRNKETMLVKELHVQPNEFCRTDGMANWEVPGNNFPDAARVARGNRAPDPSVTHVSDAPMFVRSEYLARVSRAFPKRETFNGLIIRRPSLGGAILVSSPSFPEAFAIVMPMHNFGEETEPAWMARWLAAADRTAAAMAAPAPAMPSDAAPPPEFSPVYVPHAGAKK